MSSVASQASIRLLACLDRLMRSRHTVEVQDLPRIICLGSMATRLEAIAACLSNGMSWSEMLAFVPSLPLVEPSFEELMDVLTSLEHRDEEISIGAITRITELGSMQALSSVSSPDLHVMRTKTRVFSPEDQAVVAQAVSSITGWIDHISGDNKS